MKKTDENGRTKSKRTKTVPYEKTEFYLHGVEQRELMGEIADNREEKVVLMDGLDEAIIGYSVDTDSKMHVVYSIRKCLEVFMKRDGMSYDDAMEFYSYNTERAIPYAASMGNVPITVWDEGL